MPPTNVHLGKNVLQMIPCSMVFTTVHHGCEKFLSSVMGIEYITITRKVTVAMLVGIRAVHIRSDSVNRLLGSCIGFSTLCIVNVNRFFFNFFLLLGTNFYFVSRKTNVEIYKINKMKNKFIIDRTIKYGPERLDRLKY